MKKTWEYGGDVNTLDYGGKWIRQIGSTQRYHVVRIDNMDEACGSDNEGHPKYSADLSEVDLSVLSDATLKSAIACTGLPEDLRTGLPLAEAVHSYGTAAPLHSCAGNNGWKLIAECKRESRRLEGDSAEYEARMEKPVNRIGSTAREFGKGDLDSALVRGIVAGDVSARIMGKMRGMTEAELDQAKDPSAYKLCPSCKAEMPDSGVCPYGCKVEVSKGADQ